MYKKANFRIFMCVALSVLALGVSAKNKKEKNAPAQAEQAGPATITIKGTVQFTYDGYWEYPVPAPEFKMTVYQQKGTDREVFAESEIGKDKQYTLSFQVDKPGVYIVDCGRWQSVQVWAEDENLEIDFRGYDNVRDELFDRNS